MDDDTIFDVFLGSAITISIDSKDIKWKSYYLIFSSNFFVSHQYLYLNK